MKKLTALLLAALLITALTACSPKTETKYLPAVVTSEYPGTVTIRTENEYDSEGLLKNVTTSYDGVEAYQAAYAYTDSSVTITAAQNGQTSSMTQRYEKDDSGNVIRAEVTMDGTVTSTSEMTYDENKNLLHQIQTNADGTSYETTHVYDAQGNIIQTTQDLDQGRGSVKEFTYSEDGKVLTAVSRNLNGDITTREEHSWASPTEETVRIYDGTDALMAIHTNTYDEDGNLLVNEMRDKDGTLSGRISYTYQKIEVSIT